MGPWVSADYVHGRDGMGDSGLPRARQRPAAQHAVDALVERINAAPGELTILGQAPLTNIAMAHMRDPSTARKVKALYVMGGSYLAPGNITAAAEHNFYVDPEAARIVFDAGFPLYMVGWEVAVRHGVCDDQDLREIGPPPGSARGALRRKLLRRRLGFGPRGRGEPGPPGWEPGRRDLAATCPW